jgi:hypothetical protein
VLPFEIGLFQNAIQSTRRYVVAFFACDSDAAWFRRMLQLPVTASCGDNRPPIVMQQPQHVPDFHRFSLACATMVTIRAAIISALSGQSR